MPSYDPETGKRLTGAAQRRRRREREAAGLPPSERAQARKDAHRLDRQGPVLAPRALDVGEPPLRQGPDACIVWAALAQAQAAAAAIEEPMRPALMTSVSRALGSLKKPAVDSWDACVVKQQYRGADLAALYEREAPRDAEAVPVWAFFRLCEILHQLAVGADLCAQRTRAQVEALKALGKISPDAAIDKLIDNLSKGDD